MMSGIVGVVKYVDGCCWKRARACVRVVQNGGWLSGRQGMWSHSWRLKVNFACPVNVLLRLYAPIWRLAVDLVVDGVFVY